MSSTSIIDSSMIVEKVAETASDITHQSVPPLFRKELVQSTLDEIGTLQNSQNFNIGCNRRRLLLLIGVCGLSFGFGIFVYRHVFRATESIESRRRCKSKTNEVSTSSKYTGLDEEKDHKNTEKGHDSNEEIISNIDMKQLRSDSDNNSQKFVVCEQGDSSNFTQQKIHQGQQENLDGTFNTPQVNDFGRDYCSIIRIEQNLESKTGQLEFTEATVEDRVKSQQQFIQSQMESNTAIPPTLAMLMNNGCIHCLHCQKFRSKVRTGSLDDNITHTTYNNDPIMDLTPLTLNQQQKENWNSSTTAAIHKPFHYVDSLSTNVFPSQVKERGGESKYMIEKKQIDGLEVSDKEKSITDEQKNNIPFYYPLQSISPSTNESNGGNEEDSIDSGRETGRGLISYSPFEDTTIITPGQEYEQSMYEFEIPNSLVGLIIGVGGKTIKTLSSRADVKILIRPHHSVEKFETYQICSIRGNRENINNCLHMIRYRFPPCRFPELNLRPVLLPPQPEIQQGISNKIMPPISLTFPVGGVCCEVYISAPIDASHIFVQLVTHPSFQSLALLDQLMLTLYSQPDSTPEIPKPCAVGTLCAAPAYNGWFRTIILAYDEESDEACVRFVDYGGFARVPRTDLRQIRVDFMSLPMQAIECYLGIQPIDGSIGWNDEANEAFFSLSTSKIIQGQLVGHCKENGIPVLELYSIDPISKQTVRISQYLCEKGFAAKWNPELLVK